MTHNMNFPFAQFNWTEDDNNVGIIAQTISTVAPESVSTVSVGAVGSTSSGYLYSGVGADSWNSTVLTIDQNSHNPGLKVMGKSEFEGEANFKDDVKISGVSIKETLEQISDRLALLKPNPDLESRWEELRELRRQYVELEADILEKEEIVRILQR